MKIGKWTRSLFKRGPRPPHRGSFGVWLPKDEPDPTIYGIHPVGTDEEQRADLRWLDPQESPFGIRALDCRSMTRGVVSTAQDPAQLNRYIELREDLAGESVRGRCPHMGRRLECALRYAVKPLPEGRIFGSRRLEYKWDVTKQGDALIFSRSWTGDIEYHATCQHSDDILSIVAIESPSEPRSFPTANADKLDVLAVDFLLRTYILGEIAPHPLPDDLSALEPKSLAHLSMRWFGCDARFGILAQDLWMLRNDRQPQ